MKNMGKNVLNYHENNVMSCHSFSLYKLWFFYDMNMWKAHCPTSTVILDGTYHCAESPGGFSGCTVLLWCLQALPCLTSDRILSVSSSPLHTRKQIGWIKVWLLNLTTAYIISCFIKYALDKKNLMWSEGIFATSLHGSYGSVLDSIKHA